jgi:hypothetical protein
MAISKFRAISCKEALVETMLETQNHKNELIISMRGKYVEVKITDDEEVTGRFILHKTEAQKLFDWLKINGFLI